MFAILCVWPRSLLTPLSKWSRLSTRSLETSRWQSEWLRSFGFGLTEWLRSFGASDALGVTSELRICALRRKNNLSSTATWYKEYSTLYCYCELRRNEIWNILEDQGVKSEWFCGVDNDIKCHTKIQTPIFSRSHLQINPNSSWCSTAFRNGRSKLERYDASESIN